MYLHKLSMHEYVLTYINCYYWMTCNCDNVLRMTYYVNVHRVLHCTTIRKYTFPKEVSSNPSNTYWVAFQPPNVMCNSLLGQES